LNRIIEIGVEMKLATVLVLALAAHTTNVLAQTPQPGSAAPAATTNAEDEIKTPHGRGHLMPL
jgi:hypothetical protein